MRENPSSEATAQPGVAITPLMVVTRTFTARPAAWAETREFLIAALADVDPLQATAPEVQDAIGQAILASAGNPPGTFQVSVRISPDSVEVEVLQDVDHRDVEASAPPAVPASFADWFADVLATSGLSQEQAARRLGVSVRTVGRWVRGETEPRMRDMRRVTNTFGP